MGWAEFAGIAGAAIKGGQAAIQQTRENRHREAQLSQQERIEMARLAQREDLAELQGEIKLMLEGMKEGGRNDRHEKPSGSVIAQQEGATTRTGMTTATTERGQDINRELGLLRDGTTRRGQDFTFGAAQMRDGTARRGQDLNYTLGLTRDATTRRGQDVGAETADENRASASDLARAARESRERIEQIRNQTKAARGSSDLLNGPPSPTTVPEVTTGTKKEMTPVEVVNAPVDKPAPRSPEADNDKVERIGQQLDRLVDQIKRSPKSQQEVLKKQYRDLQKQYVAAGGK